MSRIKTIETANFPAASGDELVAQSEELVEHSHSQLAQCGRLIEQCDPVASGPPHPGQDTIKLPAISAAPPRKRNKLRFKNRWLISADIVAALRRAGVDCNITIPKLYDEDLGQTRH